MALINIDDLYRYKSPDPDVFLGAYSNLIWKKWNAGFSLRANLGNYMYNNRFSNTGVQRNIIDPLGFPGQWLHQFAGNKFYR